MKKIILLTALFIAAIAQSQNYDKIKKLNATDYKTAMQLANEISEHAGSKYRLYKFHEFEKEHVLKIVFIPESVTDEQAQNGYKDKLITVEFITYMVDQNEDMQRLGVKTYKLSKVTAKYLDLFPLWKSWFVPTADAEKTLSNLDDQELRETDKKIEFYIQKNGSLWTLRNDS